VGRPLVRWSPISLYDTGSMEGSSSCLSQGVKIAAEFSPWASQGRYFLESHIVTYAPSATVLYLIRNSPMAQPPTQAFLGIGEI